MHTSPQNPAAVSSLELLEELRSDNFADDVPIEFERMRHWTPDHAAAYFESGGTAFPDDGFAPPTKSDAQLTEVLTQTGLLNLTAVLADETFGSLADLERSALLAHLKRAGCTVLAQRQKLATAIAKASRVDSSTGSDARALHATTSKQAGHTFPSLPIFVTPPSPISFAEFDEHQDKVMPGDTHRLDFPWSAAMLTDEKRFGSAWLTRAFRAFGSISAENSVHIVNVREFVGGGAASKALLTVRYDLPEEAAEDGTLQTEAIGGNRTRGSPRAPLSSAPAVAWHCGAVALSSYGLGSRAVTSVRKDATPGVLMCEKHLVEYL